MRKLLVLLMCLLSGGLAWLDARAQDPGAGIIFFQHRQFNIPFKNDERNANIKQVHLHISTDQGRSWQLATSAAPDARQFRFNAPKDGFFWFAVQTEDNAGKMFPAAPADLRPNLKVIVDTVPPKVRVQPLAPRNGEIGVSWTVTDENLDAVLPDAVRIDYRLPGGANWIPLNLPLGAGQIYWNPQANGAVEVRIQARDRAGNVGEDKTNVNAVGAQGFPNPIAPPIHDGFKDLDRKYVNNKQISLSYDLKDVGPSGVSSVELWYTLHKQRAWHKLTEYPLDLKNPPEAGQSKKLTFEVNDEGVYGITLVAKSGVGLGERCAQSGERPQVWLEVDITKPVAQILGIQVGNGPDKGKLTILWNARDKNLSHAPIRLSYSEQRDGPWTAIADKLANSGKHTWRMPDPLPYQFYVRVEAIDLAGNIGEAVTAEKVKVDLSLPKAMPLEITPGN